MNESKIESAAFIADVTKSAKDLLYEEDLNDVAILIKKTARAGRTKVVYTLKSGRVNKLIELLKKKGYIVSTGTISDWTIIIEWTIL